MTLLGGCTGDICVDFLTTRWLYCAPLFDSSWIWQEVACWLTPTNRTVRTCQGYRASICYRTHHQVREKASVKSCRNTNSRSLNQSRFITNRTGRRITDCQRFIRIHTRCACCGSKPAVIMIRWIFREFLHFVCCVDPNQFRIQALFRASPGTAACASCQAHVKYHRQSRWL